MIRALYIDEASVRMALRVMNLKQVEALTSDEPETDESLQRALDLREEVLEDAA